MSDERDDLAPAEDAPALPGEHRGGFSRALTAPTEIVAGTAEPQLRWAPAPEAPPSRWAAAWSLVFAIIGLVASFFVGWAFPVGLIAIVLAVIALRHPWESRGVAIWAMCLACASLVYSAGWLWWAWSQGDLFS